LAAQTRIGGEQSTEQDFRVAEPIPAIEAIDIGGIEQVDARLEGRVDERARVTQVVTLKTPPRHAQIGCAERHTIDGTTAVHPRIKSRAVRSRSAGWPKH